MGKPIEITRFEHSATELREVAARTHDGAAVRRLLAIALVLEGHRREPAAQLNAMDRQTLRDWVLRYNAEGVAGLRSRCSPGRPSKLSEAQMEELRTMVLEGRKRGRRITLLCAGGLVPDVVVTAEDGTAWQSALRSFTGGRCQKLVRVIVRAAGAWFQS